jgi:hypothetical protein
VKTKPLPCLLLIPFGAIALMLMLMMTVASPLEDVQAGLPGVPSGNRHAPNAPALRGLPHPVGTSLCAEDSSTLCLLVYTGTIRSRYTIFNPGGVSGFNDHHLANFDQRLLSQSSTAMEIEIVTRRWVDTRAPYPVDTGTLPGGIPGYLLPEAGWIQSDAPEIVAKAQELVSGATMQAQAAEAILGWVRGNIAYDYSFSLPNDALSVLRNRSGVCEGFSTLTVGLLRAAGIPARYELGCVTPWGWAVDDEGGWHAWIEAYYPDVGWIGSDSQTTANFVDTSHIRSGFDQCGRTGTVIDRLTYQESHRRPDSLRTHIAAEWGTLSVASIPAWERFSLKAVPAAPSVMLPISDPIGSLVLQVENLSCGDEDWQIRTGASWLFPAVVTGPTAGPAHFTVDARGMPKGSYSSPMTIYATTREWYRQATSRTITARLLLVDQVYEYPLPIVLKEKRRIL